MIKSKNGLRRIIIIFLWHRCRSGCVVCACMCVCVSSCVYVYMCMRFFFCICFLPTVAWCWSDWVPITWRLSKEAYKKSTWLTKNNVWDRFVRLKAVLQHGRIQPTETRERIKKAFLSKALAYLLCPTTITLLKIY